MWVPPHICDIIDAHCMHVQCRSARWQQAEIHTIWNAEWLTGRLHLVAWLKDVVPQFVRIRVRWPAVHEAHKALQFIQNCIVKAHGYPELFLSWASPASNSHSGHMPINLKSFLPAYYTRIFSTRWRFRRSWKNNLLNLSGIWLVGEKICLELCLDEIWRNSK